MTAAIYNFCRRITEQGPASPPEWAAFAVLWLLSWPYRGVVAIRHGLYAAGLKPVCRVNVPVISVGNLTAGGTGKTPVVDFLVKRLAGRGRKVAIVSRGYGGSFSGRFSRVADAGGRMLMTPAECGDEPFLLAGRNPQAMVYVARRRALGVAAAVAAGAEVIVLDDGFQHLAVHRDYDIVLLDARAPFANGHLLPAGLLREPLSALRRSKLIILTHDQGAPEPELPVTRPVIRCRHRLAAAVVSLSGEQRSWAELQGVRVLAFAGIAQPEGFFAALREHGVELTATIALDDHQDYSPDVLNRLAEACNNAQLILTTEKDAVKLKATDFPLPCYRVPLELEFSAPERLDRVLDELN